MSTQAITPDQFMAQQSGVHSTALTPDDFMAHQRGTSSAQPGMLDREIPLDSYTHATESGLQSIGRGVRDAVKGTVQMLDPRAKDAEEEGVIASSPQGRAALPVYRILRSLGHTAEDATHIAGAIHDINQSPDPLGAYAKVAQETAGQGAGQALVALGTEGAIKGAPAAASGVAKAARATGDVIRDVATPQNIGTAVGSAVGGYAGHLVGEPVGAGLAGGAVGRAFGKAIAKKLTTAPEAVTEIAAPELDATGENKPFAGGMDEAAPAAAPPTPAAAVQPAATPSTSPAAVEQQLNDALGGKKLVPGVSLKNQAAAQGLKLPEGFTPVDSSVLKAYKYDPATQEFDAITNSGQRFRHAEVTPDQFKAFEEADSKGKAWNDLRNGAGVTPLGKVNENGVLQPRIKPRSVVTDPETGKPEFSDVLEAKQSGGQATTTPAPKAKAAAAAAGSSSEDDLASLLQQSLDQVKAEKGGVRTTAAPADLAKRWGVDESSIEDTDRNVRGLNAEQSQAYINKLSDFYQQGRPVEPVIETRDENNNITSVDGRHRALAAKKAGIERIPVIVRRISVQ